MTCPPYIREALAQFTVCVDTGASVAVPTQCLYPSNGTVTVFITGGPNGCVVSDEGRAIAEITAQGFDVSNVEAFLRPFCTPRGLRINGARIYTQPIPAEGLPTAISLVATTSSLAAFWAVRTFRPRVRRDLRRELRDVLSARFSRERVKEEIHLTGVSGRSYRYEFLIDIGGKRNLVLDGIFPDATAINSRAVAHFDLAQTRNPLFVQRMVYDEEEDWSASDLNLLRMAAELVPLTQFGLNLDGMGLI